jgi:hypothetical protein
MGAPLFGREHVDQLQAKPDHEIPVVVLEPA